MPDAAHLTHVVAVYDRGDMPEALRCAQAFAPLQEWQGAEGCALASRIAANTGAPRLATRLAVRAVRADRNNHEARLQYCYEVFGRRGPLETWELLRGADVAEGLPPAALAEILALQGRVLGELRDFDAAEHLLSRAQALDPSRAWIGLQRAYLLEQLDRLDEALEVTKLAGGLHPYPHYRPAVQLRARLLQLLDRDTDAIDLLQEAALVLRSGAVAAQLYSLLSENGRWLESAAALDAYAALSPILEPRVARWLDSQRAGVEYRLGRRAEAGAHAGKVDDDFHRRFAEKLREPPQPPERIQLDVSFVRQHFKTCAPATLAAIGQYWKMPADHVRLAEEICYDGTPLRQQREWAEHHGWHVRSFRVTADSATALLERQVPFAISTVDATNAHMMAVAGFDSVRGVLLLRDPSQPYLVEWPVKEFFERYRAHGPCGTVFIPEAERHRLDGLELPDAEAYDACHQLSCAIEKHDRQQAVDAIDAVARSSTDASIVLHARLELASYDANQVEIARCLDGLLEIFPRNPRLLLRKLDTLRQGPRDERLAMLRRACIGKDTDGSLYIELASLLQGDARAADESALWFRRGLRRRPLDNLALKCRASQQWAAGNFERASELLWFAALSEGFSEHLYQDWFLSCRQTRRTAQAIRHLEDRFERFARRSSQPALTLAWACTEVNEPRRAMEVLRKAIALLPRDGALLLRAARLSAGAGEDAEADRWLAMAGGKASQPDVLRTTMDLAEQRLDFDAVTAHARALLQHEPVALDAHAALARVAARKEGADAARRQVLMATQSFPNHCGLRRMLVERSRETSAADAVADARALAQMEPSDAWVHRELAIGLSRLNQGDEALGVAQEAARIEPASSFSASTIGFIYRRLGRVAEARAELRRAILLSVDNTYAIHGLLELARTDDERREDLAIVERELLRQVVTGDGLLSYMEAARTVLDPHVLLGILRQAHSERPDLWHAWSALGSQLAHVQLLDEALAIAITCSERFPHLARAWMDLADVRRQRKEPDHEIAALERAFEVSRSAAEVAIALAAACERCDQLDKARAIYEQALRHSAFDARLHAFYASLLWRLQVSDRAFEAIERALRLAPDYSHARELLLDWSQQTGQPDRPARFARELAGDLHGDISAWLMLGRVLPDAEIEESLVAIGRALDIDRHSVDAWELKAQRLAVAERFEEAILACEEGMANSVADRHVLEGRRASIEAMRGKVVVAIPLMQKVLEQNTGYYWGWQMLSTWQVDTNELEAASASLERMRQLWPTDTAVYRKLAQLARKKDDPASARQALSRVVELLPTDIDAAHLLLELQLQDEDLTEAGRTLQAMELHLPGAATLAAGVAVSLRQSDLGRAVSLLEALCDLPDPNEWPIEYAVEAFISAGRGAAALRVLKRKSIAGTANPQSGAAAIRLFAQVNRWFTAVRFVRRLKSGEMRWRALVRVVQLLAENQRKWPFRWLYWTCREELRRDDAAWGQAGYALTRCGQQKSVSVWLDDWRTRRAVDPWMLFNYCIALRQVGKYEIADEVATHVIRHWGHRPGADDMHLFLGIERAITGRLEEATRHLQLTTVRADVPYDQALKTLAESLIGFLGSAPADRRQAFAEARARVDSNCKEGIWLERGDLRRTFRRVADVLIRNGAGMRGWAWSRWKLWWPAVIMPALVLLLLALMEHDF